jgi:hypothetical protein
MHKYMLILILFSCGNDTTLLRDEDQSKIDTDTVSQQHTFIKSNYKVKLDSIFSKSELHFTINSQKYQLIRDVTDSLYYFNEAELDSSFHELTIGERIAFIKEIESDHGFFLYKAKKFPSSRLYNLVRVKINGNIESADELNNTLENVTDKMDSIISRSLK